jgi:hypothetical protein
MNLMNKAVPLLNKLIPSALAVKGLSKIDNRLGSFIQNALASGYTTDHVLDFLRSSVQSAGDRREMQNLQSISQSENIHPEQQRSLQNRESQESIGKGIAGIAGLAGGLAGMDSGAPPIQNPENPLAHTPQQEKKQVSPFDFLSGYSPDLARFIKEHLDNGRTPQEAAAIARLPGPYEKYVKSIEKDTKENFVDLIDRLFGGQNSQGNMQNQSQGNNSDADLLAALDKILKM